MGGGGMGGGGTGGTRVVMRTREVGGCSACTTWEQMVLGVLIGLGVGVFVVGTILYAMGTSGFGDPCDPNNFFKDE